MNQDIKNNYQNIAIAANDEINQTLIHYLYYKRTYTTAEFAVALLSFRMETQGKYTVEGGYIHQRTPSANLVEFSSKNTVSFSRPKWKQSSTF